MEGPSVLQVHPHCLMFFVDETGHEDLADPNYPIFGLGGCAVMAAVVDQVIRTPWRNLKDIHFAGKPLHANELREPKAHQVEAIAEFFRTQRFGRFAVTLNRESRLPQGITPYSVIVPALRRRWAQIASRSTVPPTEIAIIHEASQRGDPLIERYFGESVVTIDGRQVPVHHGFMPKGDECLEVADFIIHAAGGQARNPAGPRRKNFRAVFGDRLLSSYLHIDAVEPKGII